MDTGRIKSWLSLGANIGVFIGIILLLVELDQNRSLVKAEMRHAVADQYINFMQETADSGEIADIVVRVLNGEELTQPDRLRYQFRLRAWFRIAANVHYQYEQGLFDELEFVSIKENWRGFAAANTSAIAEVWCMDRKGLPAQFRTEMDAMFPNLNCVDLPRQN